MPTISFSVPHALSRDDVVARLKRESDVLRTSLGDHVRDMRETWEDHSLAFSFTALGMAVEGRINVEPEEVRTTATVPFAAMLFKGVIEQKVRDRLRELLAT
jgi:hypothetical protein